MATMIGCMLILRDVQHVPVIMLNMISTRRLDDEGYNGSFQNCKSRKFCKGSLIVVRTQKQGILYVIHAKLCKDKANVAADSNGEL